MSLRVSVVCAVSAFLLVRPAAAQRTGTIEVGGFLRFTDFDNSLNISNTLGVGGRLGVFLIPRVSVEAEFSTTSTDSGPNLDVKHTPFHLFGVYNHPADARADIVIGIGYVHNKYTDGVSSASPASWACATASAICSPCASTPTRTSCRPPRTRTPTPRSTATSACSSASASCSM